MIRRLFTSFSLLSLLLSGLIVGEWIRSYWKTDDLFVIYNGDGSEQLRIRQGVVMFHHASPPLGKSREGIRRLSINSYRDESLATSTNSPTPFAVPKVWHSFRFERISAADASRPASAPFAGLSATMSPALSSHVSIDPRTGNIIVNPTVTTLATTQELLELSYLRLDISIMRARMAGAMPVPPAVPHWRVIFAAWSLLFIAAIPTLQMCVSLIRKRRRRSLGLCGVCVYDLTGNQSGVCPECGTAVPAHPHLSK